ncbi:hypothetical protein [Planctomycetes bacterium K23_9]|uniref:Uncharacterized protein n=1 Tax=Stieleria marina TaxID=1930275 RepID=A0A517NZ76_9BACT|nr:hypothetical protein K239x_44350 [Planctomycetes bacterium K23_9]
MRAGKLTAAKSPRNVPSWQSLRFVAAMAFYGVLLTTVLSGKVAAQLYDGLDAHPPRWSLDTSDCDARVIEHKHLADGGIDRRACETLTFTAGHGTEAILVYPIEPIQAIDGLTARVSVMSASVGARIGFRIRYPYTRDAETRRPLSTIVYGAAYDDPGAFRSIGVGAIEKPLRLKTIAVRQQHGSKADLSDPYVDAVVINAFSGAGKSSLRIDELFVDSMIPLGKSGHVSRVRDEADFLKEQASKSSSNRVTPGDEFGGGFAPLLPARRSPFPAGKVTKILQHNGEPLLWVRSLGFDGVLLSNPPTAEILREAVQARMMIYAPPPTAPDPSLQALLEPIAAWYVGSGVALDRSRVDQTAITTKRLRGFPPRWQRPIVAAPVETWQRYSPLVDAMIDDLPLRVRGMTAGEEIAEMISTLAAINGRIHTAVGVASMPPESALTQTNAIARMIGAPPPDSFRWHSMWLQVMRSLETTPEAILYRSSRSLASGSEFDSQRAMALSYVNRMVAMLAPWVSGARPAPPMRVVGAPFRCGRLQIDETQLLIATSIALRGSEVLSGDGNSMEILLSPEDATKNAWRLTHFAAERLTPETTPTGARLQIVSPDAAEIIVLSSDPSVGGKLAASAAKFAQQAGLDRWQLTTDLVRRTRQDWTAATAARATKAAPPTDLISAAMRTLNDAEPVYRAGDVAVALRMARRADAWGLRSQWQLAEALMPDWPHPTSSPPMACSAGPIQIAWQPLFQDDEGWGRNRLTTGSLDRKDVFGEDRWVFGQRQNAAANSDVQMITRGVFSGGGALRASVVPTSDDPLPGGYEGTIVQIASPSVRIPAGKAIRIDAMVRTLGFGDPHQGLLVYDTTGGQELGVLVRGQSDWTPVRLYRQTVGEQEVKVMFELIGGGEATIDEVRLQLWEPKSKPFVPLRPIAERTETSVMQR